MAETLLLTLITGIEVPLEVEDAEAALDSIEKGHTPYGREWIRVEDDLLIRRGSIVSVRNISSQSVAAERPGAMAGPVHRRRP
jgi:hypothetical protein